MRIKKGDNVRVKTGKDRGKEGKVTRVFPRRGLLVVEGVRSFKKHVRPKKQGEKGEIVDVSRPLQASNVALICPACGPVRVGVKSGKRVCKTCGKEL